MITIPSNTTNESITAAIEKLLQKPKYVMTWDFPVKFFTGKHKGCIVTNGLYHRQGFLARFFHRTYSVSIIEYSKEKNFNIYMGIIPEEKKLIVEVSMNLYGDIMITLSGGIIIGLIIMSAVINPLVYKKKGRKLEKEISNYFKLN
jgi:hypothetical protein